MLQVPTDINRTDIAFGRIKHMPKYEDVPAEFKAFMRRGQNPFCDAVSHWFYSGAKGVPNGVEIDGKTFVAKPGVNAAQALGAIQAVLGSFEPKHEHKEAACAFMLSEWFDLKPESAKD